MDNSRVMMHPPSTFMYQNPHSSAFHPTMPSHAAFASNGTGGGKPQQMEFPTSSYWNSQQQQAPAIFHRHPHSHSQHAPHANFPSFPQYHPMEGGVLSQQRYGGNGHQPPLSQQHNKHGRRRDWNGGSHDSAPPRRTRSASPLLEEEGGTYGSGETTLSQSQSQPQPTPFSSNPNSPTNDPDPKYKTVMCRCLMALGYCRYGDRCSFAHHPSELRAPKQNKKLKSRPCSFFFRDGYCPYGSKCYFCHSLRDFRRRENGDTALETFLVKKPGSRLGVFEDLGGTEEPQLDSDTEDEDGNFTHQGIGSLHAQLFGVATGSSSHRSK